ncbi:MAG: hypothetical protein ACI4V2_03640, partial [Alloprevotella sp.]
KETKNQLGRESRAGFLIDLRLSAVIGVTETSNHSNRHSLNKLQARDCVIGEKATNWGGGRHPTVQGLMAAVAGCAESETKTLHHPKS